MVCGIFGLSGGRAVCLEYECWRCADTGICHVVADPGILLYEKKERQRKMSGLQRL